MVAATATLTLKADSRGIDKATRDLKKLDRQADKTERQTKKLSKSFSTMGKVAAGVAGVMAGMFVRGVIRNTIEQENAVAQLNATLKSTGQYTTEASKAMQDYASVLQQNSIYGDEAIIVMQSQLLTFKQLSGDVLPRTTRAVLDLSTKMDQGLKESAVQLGKALNDPIANLGALGRVGIQFTKDQKELIKTLAETGRLAEAQGIILTELESQFGGAAKAARDTLGGALEGLKNNFGDLLEVTDGGSGATAAINDLADTLARPEVKQGFQTLATGALRLLEIMVQLPGAVGYLKDELLQLFGIVDNDDFVRRSEEIDELEEQLISAKEAASAWYRTENNIYVARAASLVNEIALKKALLQADMDAAGIAAAPLNEVPFTAKHIDLTNQLGTATKELNNENARGLEIISVTAEKIIVEDDAIQNLITRLERELELTGLTNEERDVAVALRKVSAAATEEERQKIEELIRAKYDLLEADKEIVQENATNGLFNSVTDSATNFFTSFIDGTKSAKDAFKDFAKSVLAEIAKILIQKALLSLFGAPSGGFSSGGAAVGGIIQPNSITQVNERGMEMFSTGGRDYLMTGSQGGRVTTNNNISKPVNTSITVNLPPQAQQRTAVQTADEVLQLQRRANTRNR